MDRHHHRAVVQHIHPSQTRRRTILFIGFLLLLVVVVYFYGHYRGANDSMPISTIVDRLRAEIQALETQVTVDQQALDELRLELAHSRGAVDEIERELAFYREVIAPEKTSKGVILRQPVFRKDNAPGEWRYRLIVQQGGRKQAIHKGEIFVVLWGSALGSPVKYTLTELNEALLTDALALSFRYFQRFEGRVLLPTGFEPERVEIQIVVSKPVKDLQKISYAWPDVAFKFDEVE